MQNQSATLKTRRSKSSTRQQQHQMNNNNEETGTHDSNDNVDLKFRSRIKTTGDITGLYGNNNLFLSNFTLITSCILNKIFFIENNQDQESDEVSKQKVKILGKTPNHLTLRYI